VNGWIARAAQRPRRALASRSRAMQVWMKRVGLAGFAFFLVKGVAWLVFAGLSVLAVTW
jgi:hypothetical protein